MKKKTDRTPPEPPVNAWPGNREPAFDDLDDEEFTDGVPEPDLAKPKPKPRKCKQ